MYDNMSQVVEKLKKDCIATLPKDYPDLPKWCKLHGRGIDYQLILRAFKDKYGPIREWYIKLRFDWIVEKMREGQSYKWVQAQSGYSRQMLEIKFREKLGMAPREFEKAMALELQQKNEPKKNNMAYFTEEQMRTIGRNVGTLRIKYLQNVPKARIAAYLRLHDVEYTHLEQGKYPPIEKQGALMMNLIRLWGLQSMTVLANTEFNPDNATPVQEMVDLEDGPHDGLSDNNDNENQEVHEKNEPVEPMEDEQNESEREVEETTFARVAIDIIENNKTIHEYVINLFNLYLFERIPRLDDHIKTTVIRMIKQVDDELANMPMAEVREVIDYVVQKYQAWKEEKSKAFKLEVVLVSNRREDLTAVMDNLNDNRESKYRLDKREMPFKAIGVIINQCADPEDKERVDLKSLRDKLMIVVDYYDDFITQIDKHLEDS
jgi:hypothetical protein